jgi:hypothetical protein
MPLSVTDYNVWMTETYENVSNSSSLTWVKNIYWKLEVYSCILVKRQREWFQAAVPAFVSIWDTILRERVSGEYVKRAPKKRTKTEPKDREVLCEIQHEPLNEIRPIIQNDFLNELKPDTPVIL